MDTLMNMLSAFSTPVTDLESDDSPSAMQAHMDTGSEVDVFRHVSGTYRGSLGDFELDLRIDIDGERPLNMISGDLFEQAGATLRYLDSFTVFSPAVTASDSVLTAEGLAQFRTLFGTYNLQISIVRAGVSAAPPPARAVFRRGGRVATFDCAFQSTFFRMVEFEEDRVAGVTPFNTDNSRLPKSHCLSY